MLAGPLRPFGDFPDMLEALTNSVLPVFSVAALGMLSQRLGLFDSVQANTLSRFVYFITMPVLLFRLLAMADPEGYHWGLLGSYIGVELAIYAGSFVLFRTVFRRDFRQSLLLAMATVFANHILYLLPIAVFRFGESAAIEMVSFVIADIIVIYLGTMILLDVISDGGGGALAAAGRTLRNPQIWAIPAGIAASFLKMPLDNGIGVFLEFASGAAAPVSLFALGIMLTSLEGRSDWRIVGIITLIKLVIVPLAMALIVLNLLGFAFADADMGILIATAPSGVMSFVLAMRFGVPARDISMAVLVTTVLSVFSVAAVLQMI